MKIISIQPSEFVDHITEDGTELTKLPYPFHVFPDGRIDRQDFWRGNPSRVVGFVRDSNRQEVDVFWSEAAKDPQSIVGTYVVTRDKEGGMASWPTAIRDVEVREVPDPLPVIDPYPFSGEGKTRYDG